VERYRRMKKLSLVLCVALAGSGSLAQTDAARRNGGLPAPNPLVNPFDEFAKRFPPDVMPKRWQPAKESRSNCVYASPDKKSLLLKPCEPRRTKTRFARPLMGGPPPKP
jgi:hypothetical protein